jgi:uncharacterized protein (DUF488 family)
MTKTIPTYNRQRLALALLDACGGELSKIDFQKLLFLYSRENDNKSYSFVPYKFGCFSFQAKSDMEMMEQYGFIAIDDKLYKKTAQKSFLGFVLEIEAERITAFADNFKSLRGKKLISYVYTQYPYYTINSEIAREYVSAQVVEEARINIKERQFFTIGYEGVSIDAFIDKLIKNNIRALVDVRKNAISMKFGFSKRFLQNALKNTRINYIHIPDLGVPSENRKELSNLNDYDRLFEEYEQTILPFAIKELSQLSHIYNTYGRVAIMCYEKDAAMCHRGRIAKTMSNNYNININHL